MKTVEYMGVTFECPDWANFVAADADGSTYVFEKQPTWDKDWWHHTGGNIISLGYVVMQPPLKRV